MKDYKDKSSVYYGNHRPEIQELFPVGAKRVLDIGCGSGAMLKELKERHTFEAWGVELMEEAAESAREKLDNVINDTIENSLDQLPENYFDLIFFNDVLEHLPNPNKLLVTIKSKLADNGKIISSIPNVRYHRVFGQYIFKSDWKYEGAGVMDFTHLRFFTSKSIKRMYEQAGYKILSHKGINKSRSLKPFLYNILMLFTALDMYYPQYATIAVKKD